MDKAVKQSDKPGRAATLIPYARSILQAMKENGYRGTVWDEVLNEYEKATAPLPEIGALPSSCEGYGVCLRHACLSAGRCTISAPTPPLSATPQITNVKPPCGYCEDAETCFGENKCWRDCRPLYTVSATGRSE